MSTRNVIRPEAGGPEGGDRKRALTGRAVLFWLLGFFGVVIGVNLWMAGLAIETMPGTEVDSSYQAGNNYNAEIQAARNQAIRHWQVAGEVTRSSDGRAVIEVRALDADGAALSGLHFSARLERPTDKRQDRTLALADRGDGRYRGEVEAVLSGQWDLVLDAYRGAERMFVSKNRMLLK